jgi:hypothetical protein
MQSLAEILLGASPNPVPERIEVDESKPQKKVKDASKKTMSSYERNKHKPCKKCDKPRHVSINGNCHTTLCTEHRREDQEIQRGISREGKT